jgi:hypothetical protein
LNVELLYWVGCPSHESARSMLEDVLAEHEIAEPVALVEVNTIEEAAELGFPGSPTIRIDGADVDPAGAGGRPSLSCRIYRSPDGRASPLPTREQIEEALKT